MTHAIIAAVIMTIRRCITPLRMFETQVEEGSGLTGNAAKIRRFRVEFRGIFAAFLRIFAKKKICRNSFRRNMFG
jgi:hypothetical protein